MLIHRRSGCFRQWALAIVIGVGALSLTASPAQAEEDKAAQPPPFSDTEMEYFREQMKKLASMWEFHGYLRSGIGFNDEGGDQHLLRAPGAEADYRLGNEAETYIESTLVARWPNPNPDDAWFKIQLLVTYITNNNRNFDTTNRIGMRESYIQGGNVIKSVPELKFWAGNRYYRRWNVHMIDFFYLNMSGYGGGFEDLPVGSIGKLAVAYLGGSLEDEEFTTGIGRYYKHNLDMRLYDVDVPLGKGMFWLNLANTRGRYGLAGSPGIAAGFIHKAPGLVGGENVLSIQYARGSASNLAPDPRPPADNIEDSWVLRILDSVLLQPSDKFSMTGIAVFQLRDSGDDGDSTVTWMSVGARPILHFTPYVALASEIGIDMVQQPGDDADMGVLGKLTFAAQVTAGTGFYARPNIRVYTTLATWNDTFKGEAVAGPAHATENNAVIAGVQAEAWW